MKRGFWVLIAAILLILVLGVLFYPTASKQVQKRYSECISEEPEDIKILTAIKTKDVSNCEQLSEKEFCAALVNEDSAFCENLVGNEKEICFATITKNASRCQENWRCLAYASQDEFVCTQEQIPRGLKEECAAISRLDPDLYEQVIKQDCLDRAFNEIAQSKKTKQLCLSIQSELLKQTCLDKLMLT
jgi:hypothetical protein